MKRIDLIVPHGSQYNVLHHFTRKLYEAWLRAGYEARLLIDHPQSHALNEMIANPPDLIIGFNGIPRVRGERYCDIIGKPYLALIVDPFYFFIGELDSPYLMIGCDDYSSVVGFKNVNFERTLFVPHAVERDLSPDPSEKKIYDVVMLATFIDHEEYRKNWISKFPRPVSNAIDRAIELTFSDSKLPFTAALMGELKRCIQEYPELIINDSDILKIFKGVERYIKGKERIEMIQAVQTSPVHVFGSAVDGSDWRKFFKGNKNIIVHDPISFEKSLQILKQSKIVLNASIKNKFGAHERIFSSLASGALVITHENDYLQQFFTHDIDIAYYQYWNLMDINRTIHTYLSDEERRELVVESGREITMSYHTWDARVKSIEKELPNLLEKIKNLI